MDLHLKARVFLREFSETSLALLILYFTRIHTITYIYPHFFFFFFFQVVDGIQDRRACFSWKNNCCYRSTQIRVRNCGKFYVYNLPSTKGCQERYCGNGKNLNMALKKLK